MFSKPAAAANRLLIDTSCSLAAPPAAPYLSLARPLTRSTHSLSLSPLFRCCLKRRVGGRVRVCVRKMQLGQPFAAHWLLLPKFGRKLDFPGDARVSAYAVYATRGRDFEHFINKNYLHRAMYRAAAENFIPANTTRHLSLFIHDGELLIRNLAALSRVYSAACVYRTSLFFNYDVFHHPISLICACYVYSIHATFRTLGSYTWRKT